MLNQCENTPHNGFHNFLCSSAVRVRLFVCTWGLHRQALRVLARGADARLHPNGLLSTGWKNSCRLSFWSNTTLIHLLKIFWWLVFVLNSSSAVVSLSVRLSACGHVHVLKEVRSSLWDDSMINIYFSNRSKTIQSSLSSGGPCCLGSRFGLEWS